MTETVSRSAEKVAAGVRVTEKAISHYDYRNEATVALLENGQVRLFVGPFDLLFPAMGNAISMTADEATHLGEVILAAARQAAAGATALATN